MGLFNFNKKVEINGVRYEICKKKVTARVVKSSKATGNVAILSEVEGKRVKEIGKFAFERCKGITNVSIPNGITHIERGAFRDCSGLKEIVIPNSVTHLSGFSGCTELTNVKIPSSVTHIGSFAFVGCTGLTDIIIPDNVTDVGNNAFSECKSLKKVVIGKNVTSIAYATFKGCESLSSIVIPGNVKFIQGSAQGGPAWGGAFEDCTGLAEVIIESGVESIGQRSFMNCILLSRVTIPKSVTYIFWEDKIGRPELLETNNKETPFDILGGRITKDKPKREKLVFYVQPGSTAEKFAEKWRYEFKYLENMI